MNRTRRCAVAVLALTIVLPASGRGWKTPPDLPVEQLPAPCAALEVQEHSKFRLSYPGAENWPVYRLLHDELEFRVALDSATGVVRAIETKDHAFRTAEGVGLGTKLADVQAQAQGELRCPEGWTCFIDLPSGWMAGFSTVHSDPETRQMKYKTPGNDSRVNSLVRIDDCG